MNPDEIMPASIRRAATLPPFAQARHLRGHSPRSAMLVLLSIANFLPAETSIFLSSLRLPPARLVLLLSAPYLCLSFARKFSGGRYRFVASDLFVLLTGVWMLCGTAVGVGVGDALNHAGPEVLDFCLTYFAARALLSAPGQAASLINVLCIVIAVVGLVSVLDSVTDRFLIHEVANTLIGFGKDVVGRPDYRLGIRRAAGPLEHPILLGASCMVGLLCSLALPLRGRLFSIAGSVAGLIVCVSSAPLQGLIIGCGFLTYNRLFAWFRYRWTLLLILLATVLALSFMVLGSPVGFVNQYLVFDPESGYSRQVEWEAVGNYIAASPWIGIGFGWDEIAVGIGTFASIDSVWLGKALIYGIPCSVLIALSLIGSTFFSTQETRNSLTAADARLRTVLSIIICLLLFLGFTVYFWGSLWILSALLAGTRAHLGELERLEDP